MALVSCLSALAAAAAFGGAAAARAGGSPGWREQVEAAKEVSALSDRIHATRVTIAHWRSLHDKARDFHERQSKLIRRQIAVRKRQLRAMNEELDGYKAAQEERYENKMCMLLLKAFHLGGDDAAKVRVLKICHGLKKLSLSAWTSRRSPWPRAALERAARAEGAWEGRLNQRLGRIVHSLAATERCYWRRCSTATGACGGGLRGGPDLAAMLRELKAALAGARAAYNRDRERWAAERTELGKEESALGDSVLDLHTQKQAISVEAAKKSEELFCPVVKANYGMSEENILKHISIECQ